MTSSGSLVETLRSAPRSERRRLLAQAVDAEVRDALQMSPDEHLPTGESVFGLGLTSLGAVELKERLEARCDCVIDADVLFNHPTVAHLVSYLADGALRDLFAGTPDPAAPGAPAAEASTKDLVNDLLNRIYRG